MLPKFNPNKIMQDHVPKVDWKWNQCLHKEVSDDITKATSDWEKVWPFRTNNLWGITEVVPSAPALIKALEEPPRDKRSRQNIKYSGNNTFGETVNTAQLENFLQLLKRPRVLHSLTCY